MSMVRYFLKRLISMIPVVIGVLTLTFVLSRMMPGDPVLAYLPPGKADLQAYTYWRHKLSS